MDEDRRKEREARRRARLEKNKNDELPICQPTVEPVRRRRRGEENNESITEQTKPTQYPYFPETGENDSKEIISDINENDNVNVLMEDEVQKSSSENVDPIEDNAVEIAPDETEESHESMKSDEDVVKIINENNAENVSSSTDNQAKSSEIQEEISNAKVSVQEVKRIRMKRKGLGGLSPEKKKLLRQLIMQKAAEEMKAEAKRRQEAKERFLKENVPELQLENMDQGQLQIFLKSLHSRIETLESEKYDIEIKIMNQNYEINEFTLKVNDGKGKFTKPVLKKVSKTETQLSRLAGKDEKTSIMDFREHLKSTGFKKYALEDKEDVNNHNKIEWRESLKATKDEEEINSNKVDDTNITWFEVQENDEDEDIIDVYIVDEKDNEGVAKMENLHLSSEKLIENSTENENQTLMSEE